MPSPLLQSARGTLELLEVDPAQAEREANRLLALAQAGGDDAAQSVLERVLGRVCIRMADMGSAIEHCRRAVRAATRAGDDQLRGEARMTLALALNRTGDARRALREIERAIGDLDDAARPRALVQRATIHQELDSFDDALADYGEALPPLRRAGDLVWVQGLLMNRGVLYAFRHDYDAAVGDLREAAMLCEQLGLTHPLAAIEENLVLVYQRLGDIPAALTHFDRAERLAARLGTPTGSLMLERAELLLSVRLFDEAREAAELAVADFERRGRVLGLPEARLVLARLTMIDARLDTAYEQARRAAAEFTRQRRQAWAALARYAALQIAAEDPARPTPPLSRMVAVADDLDREGWARAALDARMLAGRSWVASRGSARRVAQARGQLELVSAGRHRGPAMGRTTAWHALALLRQGREDYPGASAAALAGLQILAEHRATMAATDLRARVSGLGQDLAAIGLRNALARGRPFDVVVWAERGRAQHLLQRPVKAPDDPELARLLARLRRLTSQLDEAESVGHKGPPANLQVQLERRIRDLSRRRHGAAVELTETCPTRAELRTLLGSAALVEYVQSDGLLHAVLLAGRRTTVVPVGSVAAVAGLVRWLPFALSRLARLTTRDQSKGSAVAMLRHTAAALSASLVEPLRPLLGDRDLVIAPTGPLQFLPWSILPGLAGRAVTVTPSAALWAAAIQREPRPGGVVVAAGPGLPGGDSEAIQIAALYGVSELRGADATVDRVGRALEGAAMAHLAAHGTVRADNPLFSALRMSDGPLTVFDLERLDHDADTVVLAACESGRSVVLAGDELLGLSATLLAGDTRHLVASVVPVPDAETRPLMVALHERLLAGETVAAALAQAQAGIDEADPVAFAAAAGFICLGAGHGRP
ncbi:MAG TPA: CHAT domain-containing protein, partial [Candidatus Lustribacter sp.]|nr:CHAT domain-containing protein [Candidatus Lustribacter sp.]